MTWYLVLAVAAGLGTWLATRAWRRSRTETPEKKVNRALMARKLKDRRRSGDRDYPIASPFDDVGS